MPSFQKSPPELITRFDALAELVPEATRRQMFGYPTCVVGGNMFMGLHQDRLVLRLGDEERSRFMEEHGAAVFEPMPGRPMREYVVVPPAMIDAPELEQWIERSFAHAQGLPAKQPKRKASR